MLRIPSRGCLQPSSQPRPSRTAAPLFCPAQNSFQRLSTAFKNPSYSQNSIKNRIPETLSALHSLQTSLQELFRSQLPNSRNSQSAHHPEHFCHKNSSTVFAFCPELLPAKTSRTAAPLLCSAPNSLQRAEEPETDATDGNVGEGRRELPAVVDPASSSLNATLETFTQMMATMTQMLKNIQAPASGSGGGPIGGSSGDRNPFGPHSIRATETERKGRRAEEASGKAAPAAPAAVSGGPFREEE
ncbi:hypothetical protein M5K25_006872 [Dendrobium thyrsiflorum]|uniref:Uncharacterized protein n=1 Tax=Dendrobium thyrsiflorum TaxID=117978 RepID=A0ABD0VCQ0_DENTH